MLCCAYVILCEACNPLLDLANLSIQIEDLLLGQLKDQPIVLAHLQAVHPPKARLREKC